MVKAGISDEGTAAERVWVRVQGHARYSQKGSDIVCAAVSVLVQTFMYAVVELVQAKVIEESRGDVLEVSVLTGGSGKESRKDIILLFRQCLIGVREVAAGYPDNVVMENEEKTDGS